MAGFMRVVDLLMDSRNVWRISLFLSFCCCLFTLELQIDVSLFR